MVMILSRLACCCEMYTEAEDLLSDSSVVLDQFKGQNTTPALWKLLQVLPLWVPFFPLLPLSYTAFKKIVCFLCF